MYSSTVLHKEQNVLHKEQKITSSRVVLVGNPNVGKTTLFNGLTGLRMKTANFPGTTLDLRNGPFFLPSGERELLDLPGLYSLESATSEERVALDAILETESEQPALIILILDATNLVRNLYFAAQVLRLGIPTVIALNMIDLARNTGMVIDAEALEEHLSAPVVPMAARTGEGIDTLRKKCNELLSENTPQQVPKLLAATENPSDDMLYNWAESVYENCVVHKQESIGRKTELADKIFTHPVGGLLAFMSVLFIVFYLIFSFAGIPMDFIDSSVGRFGEWVGTVLPEGLFQRLVVDGIIAGVGGVLVFLPQICILFFCLSLLEDTGYLARAACVMDRYLRKVGLPGKAFVPLLAAHACAIPGIMATRTIEDRRDRLTTILVLPLMTCAARLPVYAMITALLFPHSPLKGAALFTGAYLLGISAAMAMAFLFRRTLLKGPMQPLMLELPNYKMPSVKTALITAYERGKIFLRKAGTVIMAISIVLWALMTFPQPPAQSELTADAALNTELSYSYAAMMGKGLEPIIEPLGFDWRIGVGIVASFAAREVVISALSVIFGVEGDGEENSLLFDRLKEAKRSDGSPLFTFASSISLLVFYVLAMQCLPTQAVTKRETGSWKWAIIQLAYMTVLAYTASLITYQSLSALGMG